MLITAFLRGSLKQQLSLQPASRRGRAALCVAAGTAEVPSAVIQPVHPLIGVCEGVARSPWSPAEGRLCSSRLCVLRSVSIRNLHLNLVPELGGGGCVGRGDSGGAGTRRAARPGVRGAGNRHSNPLQCSCPENPTDRGTYRPWGCSELDMTEAAQASTPDAEGGDRPAPVLTPYPVPAPDSEGHAGKPGLGLPATTDVCVSG